VKCLGVRSIQHQVWSHHMGFGGLGLVDLRIHTD